ncbi:MAG: type II toxin-antitoxin system VapC family toxin [Proteobacteria bacterium]|nr:type II toxin-antitoxin system VapC family toxin [Pseudomonadota bacterium]
MRFVLDNSVAMCWLEPPAKSADASYAVKVLKALTEAQALVPSIWALEAANVITKMETRGEVTEARTQGFIALLERLNIAEDKATTAHALGETLNLARRYKLSSYDAAYLELALRAGLPIATLDADLAKAAKKAGVALYAAK